MKTGLTIAIELDVSDPADAERFEEELRVWLEGRNAVCGLAVMEQGDINGALWREARAAAFGSRLRSPFARVGGAG